MYFPRRYCLVLSVASVTLGCTILGCAILPGAPAAAPPQEATPEETIAFFRGKGMTVLTFVGFSGNGYEDNERMLAEAAAILAGHDPRTSIVNLGATKEGIGAIYGIARQRGFFTTGIVSTLARDEQVPLSPFVDRVFYVRDESWGGYAEGTRRLSPTSSAMVGASDIMVGIGGGDIARDELIAARQQQKTVRFIDADMNRRTAREAARRKGLPEPTDFRGSASAAFAGAADAAPAPGQPSRR